MRVIYVTNVTYITLLFRSKLDIEFYPNHDIYH
jgi:hypothetical protein